MRAIQMLFVVVALAVAGADAVAETGATQTLDYVVREGDTCIAIAGRELGDRDRYVEIHRLNPQLGSLPHQLVPGQILRLPRAQPTADANLAGAQGSVRVRAPSAADWSTAQRGMDLFRAWRVSTADRSTAEVQFQDRSRLGLRENTIVIVYGPDRTRARTLPGEAVLEHGTLRARLRDLSGLRISTPTATARLAGGAAAVVEVGDGGASTVSNHGDSAVELRGKRRGSVAVRAGMGSRVRPGKPPEKPRPLPPAPAWDLGQPRAFAAPGGVATLEVAWQPVAAAATYRVEFLDEGEVVGTTVAAATGPRRASMTAPAGAYAVRVSARTSDGLEGRPAQLELIAIAVALAPPGGPRPQFPLPPRSGPAALRGARGSQVVAYGAVCDADGRGGSSLDVAGTIAVRCVTASGQPLTPVAVEVVALRPVLSSPSIPVGVSTAVTVELGDAVVVGPELAVASSPGLVVEKVVPGPAGLELRLRGVRAGAHWISVRDRRFGTELARVALTVTAP